MKKIIALLIACCNFLVYSQDEIPPFNLEPINESISKKFKYDFPEIIDFDKVRKFDFSIADFTEEKKEFYEKYVGCYLSENACSKEYLSKHLSEVEIQSIENGIVFWGFCKCKDGIYYSPEDKKFYVYETFSVLPIEKITDHGVSEYFKRYGYKKFTDCKLVTDLIAEKKAKVNRKPLTKAEEKKVRDFLSEFYLQLSKDDVNKIIDDNFISTEKTKEVKFALLNNRMNLNYRNEPFDIYINVFFNDNIDDFDEDTIFVELKYKYSLDYVSFALKEVDGKLKILKYVERFDEE